MEDSRKIVMVELELVHLPLQYWTSSTNSSYSPVDQVLPTPGQKKQLDEKKTDKWDLRRTLDVVDAHEEMELA